MYAFAFVCACARADVDWDYASRKITSCGLHLVAVGSGHFAVDLENMRGGRRLLRRAAGTVSCYRLSHGLLARAQGRTTCPAKSATATAIAAPSSFVAGPSTELLPRAADSERGQTLHFKLCPRFCGVGSQRGQLHWKALAAADSCAELSACGGI